MKIQAINTNLYNVLPFRKTNNKISDSNLKLSSPLNADVVSFSAKKYDADCITNPTNHCGYCGCKVYTEAQIEGISKELMGLKAERLQGKVKSILEKLEGAKHSEEIALAKRLENTGEIDFFNKFLEAAQKKSYLKGAAIFEQVYQKKQEEALALLNKNMHPLLRTIDHISPQNREEENTNSDINLIEACYCCNHDLKKGSSFPEFYTMFPSIRRNMPSDKFNYAQAHLLEGDQSGIMHRLSAANILKSLQRLIIQRNETQNNLNTINYRISGIKSQIDTAVDSIKEEITGKKEQIAESQERLAELNKDPEFVAIKKREQLENSLSNVNGALNPLRERKKNASNSINELRNPKRAKKKGKRQQNPKVQPESEKEAREKQEKIEALKQVIESVSANIQTLEEKQQNIETQLNDLNKEFPTVEILQGQKRNLENIINFHTLLRNERESIASNEEKKVEVEEEVAAVSKSIKENPFKKEKFNPGDYSPEEEALYQRYISVSEAVSYLEQHPNGGDTNIIIKSAAKQKLQEELLGYENEPIIVDYHNSEDKKSAIAELARLQKLHEGLVNSINTSVKQCHLYEAKTEEISEEEAIKRLKGINEALKRTSERQSESRLPQKIATLEAEVKMLNKTIEELESQKDTTAS